MNVVITGYNCDTFRQIYTTLNINTLYFEHDGCGMDDHLFVQRCRALCGKKKIEAHTPLFY